MSKEIKTARNEIKEKLLMSLNDTFVQQEKKTQKQIEKILKKAAKAIAQKLNKAQTAKSKKKERPKDNNEATVARIAASKGIISRRIKAIAAHQKTTKAITPASTKNSSVRKKKGDE